MNFITFSTASTNIFPMANSVGGGQYATEFNLRTRESICTPESVTYMIGPSYVHGEADFKVTVSLASKGKLLIAPGRGVINGHFVENLAPMEVDVLAARALDSSLVGPLCLGIRAMYSTLPTMAGTILVENDALMYEGVQLVLLPEAQFKLPIDAPTDEDAVTAHIKLASFTFRNGQISGLVNNYPAKCQAFDAVRVGASDDQLDNRYLSKAGLNGRNLYVFAGKGQITDPTGARHDTWCIAQDALMIWDANTQLGHIPHDNTEEAAFVTDPISGKVQLYMPHKQLDYDISDTHGQRLYYQPKIISLPGANYTTGTPGTVTPQFIQDIKDKITALGRYQATPAGPQITYIDELRDRADLPAIKPSWLPGSYILVGHDYTVAADINVIDAPATMYVIQYGLATNVHYLNCTFNSNSIPAGADGLELARATFDADAVVQDPNDDAASNAMWNIGDGGEYHANVGRHDYLVAVTTRLAGYHVPDGSIYASDIVDSDSNLLVNAEELSYYVVTAAGSWTWTDPIWLTAQLPFATESSVGGFLNVPDTALDYGYVYLDDTGHLRLLDYELLRSGTLAYQLGEDVTLTGLTLEALQAELDDRVNNRVVFPNMAQIARQQSMSYDSRVINITIELVDDPNNQVVRLHGIDSRFGALVNLTITGNASANTILLISDCARIKINNIIGGTPTIQLVNCGLYYDALVMDAVDSISGLKLWYEPMMPWSDVANISVDGLTVTAVDPQVIPADIDFWSPEDPNDNHYEYALRSITFDGTGQVVGASIMIRNNSTYNVDPGETIYISDFKLPQGVALNYPESRIAKQIRIDGTFVSAYWSTQDSQYILTTTSFTAVSQTYRADISEGYVDYVEQLGTISLFSNTVVTANVSGYINGQPVQPGVDIDGWAPDSFHVFSGGIVS